VLSVSLLQVGGDSLRGFAHFINPNLVMGRWSFYIIFGGVQLMLSMVRGAAALLHGLLCAHIALFVTIW
jgi:hypothetical protein